MIVNEVGGVRRVGVMVVLAAKFAEQYNFGKILGRWQIYSLTNWKLILTNSTSRQNQRQIYSLTWIKKNEKSHVEVEFN